MEYRENFQIKGYGLNGCDTFFSHFSGELLVSVFVLQS